MCVYPANMANCYPGFYTTAASLGSLAGQISSARRGCFSKTALRPDNYMSEPEDKNANGASGFFPARHTA
jgi:hypothetical protein